jgi:hypothetical protein
MQMHLAARRSMRLGRVATSATRTLRRLWHGFATNDLDGLGDTFF